MGGAVVGAGIANRIGDRPAATLPGLGDRRPAIGQLPASERRDQLASRLRGDGPRRDGIERPNHLPNRDWNQVRNDWRDHRNDIRNDWRDYRDDVRDDWQDWRDDRYPWHRRWYWGYATGYWNRWDYLWDDYPAAAAVGLTWWGVNSLAYGFGYNNYYNPYYVETGGYSYAEPIVTTINVPVEGEPATTTYVEPPQENLDKFTQAQNAFENGNYEEALALVDEAAVEWPTDPVLHEFRSLVLFALKQYSESAAAIHAVLAVGPGWDWKTLSSLYPNVEVYTSQLRALETSCKEHPKAADLRFLLGYHYLTLGHNESALKAFQEVCGLQPKDEVAASLVRSLSPRETAEPAKETTAETPKPVPSADIVGTWKAEGKDSSKFTMVLDQDGNFVWSFTKDRRKDEVKGVYSIEGNVLAMEPETGGVLLAELTVESSDNLAFKMVGSEDSDSDLNFQRSRE